MNIQVLINNNHFWSTCTTLNRSLLVPQNGRIKQMNYYQAGMLNLGPWGQTLYLVLALSWRLCGLGLCLGIVASRLNMKIEFMIISRKLLAVLWHCWLGDKKGIRPVKMGVSLLVVMIWLEHCTSHGSSCHNHLHHSSLQYDPEWRHSGADWPGFTWKSGR